MNILSLYRDSRHVPSLCEWSLKNCVISVEYPDDADSKPMLIKVFDKQSGDVTREVRGVVLRSGEFVPFNAEDSDFVEEIATILMNEAAGKA